MTSSKRDVNHGLLDEHEPDISQIPKDYMAKWQKSLDVLAAIAEVPAALIMSDFVHTTNSIPYILYLRCVVTQNFQTGRRQPLSISGLSYLSMDLSIVVKC